MKNPTILKDELSLLRADKSAVVTELRKYSKALKDELIEISKLESKREVVKRDILEDTARLDDIRNRAVVVRDELAVSKQDLKNINNANDLAQVKNSQETKLHLGRIKELEVKEEDTVKETSRLKSVYDTNYKVYNEHESHILEKIFFHFIHTLIP